MQLISSIRTNLTSLALFAIALCGLCASIASAQQDDQAVQLAQSSSKTFQLLPNPKFLNCLEKSPNKTPSATVVVTKGKLNDTLTLTVKNVKPNVAFDLFTVENTVLNPNGTSNGNTNFGLAWYQSDIEANGSGTAKVTIHTILFNQIFGFDAGASLAPTHTFHVGFWFNDPNDAAPCNFDVSNPTPFNGEQNAGPLAMISVTDPGTGLGPLCFSATEGVCDN
jgi:hypothetical protein